MGHAIVAGGARASVPVTGIKLGDIAVGQLVKINENGSPVEFYVAKHDYESALNGAGRTLLVRKDAHSCQQWSSSGVNAYANSTVDSWLNGTYKDLLDEAVKTAMETTKFYYTPGNGTYTVSNLSRSIFIPSATELSVSWGYINTEGSVLPVASVLQGKTAVYNSTTLYQWTRSPSTYTQGSTKKVIRLSNESYSSYVTSKFDDVIPTGYGAVCPCFTLPSTTLFDSETLLFKGVA